MLKKAIDIFKKNPLITIVYFAYVVVTIIITMFMAESLGVNINSAESSQVFSLMGKLLGWWIILAVFSIIFTSGFGSMLASAVNDEKPTMKTLFKGIDKFIGRMLLAGLLSIVFVLGLITLLTLIAIPLFMSLSKSGSAANIISGTIVYAVVILAVFIFIYPFFMLWYPSIFVDDLGVIEGLRKGAKTSIKCYWTLVLTLIISAIPSIIYSIATEFLSNNDNSVLSQLSSPWYWIYTIVTIFISITVLIFVCMLYKEKKGDKPDLTGDEE